MSREVARIGKKMMEIVEDVVIVGAGIAGLSTSLGLHRIGIASLVLESSSTLRVTGFALGIWSNGWKALDALGIAQTLRQQHLKLEGVDLVSNVVGDPGKPRTGQQSLNLKGKNRKIEKEVRCVQRKVLLEVLESELPSGTIRYSSKIVSIEESEHYTLVHLADGTFIKTKVLIGCDGVNSVVAKWLGFKNAAFTSRSSIRACADVHHEFGPRFKQFFGNGFIAGFMPCDELTVYWFFSWTPSAQEKEWEDNPAQLKQFLLRKLDSVPDQIRNVVEMTELDRMSCSHLRYRYPWELLWGNISKGNVCVAGDALHLMTPDIGQGGCSALEDAVVLARCIGEALKKRSSTVGLQERDGEEEASYKRVEAGLKKYASERRWRSFDLILTSYLIGAVQQSGGVVVSYLRDSIFSKFLAGLRLKKAEFDCGKLSVS